MTRRTAIHAVLAAVFGSLQQNWSSTLRIDPQAVSRVVLALGETPGAFREIEVRYNGERVVLTAAEVFAALQGKEGAQS